MKENTIYNLDCITGMKNKIDNESVDLIIADPPYYKVVGQKWDYMWKTEDDYIEWSKNWINEASRTLRKGGSFYLFGYFRILSKLLPILESSGLELRQQIIINKGIRAVSGRATKKYKMFPNVTESILFMYKDSKPFVKKFLKQRQTELGLTAKEINEKLGVKSNGGGMWSIYTGKNIIAAHDRRISDVDHIRSDICPLVQLQFTVNIDTCLRAESFVCKDLAPCFPSGCRRVHCKQ